MSPLTSHPSSLTSLASTPDLLENPGTVLILLTTSRISCHLLFSLIPPSSLLKHSWIQDKSPPTQPPVQPRSQRPLSASLSLLSPPVPRGSVLGAYPSQTGGKGEHWTKRLLWKKQITKLERNTFLWSLGVFFTKFQQKRQCQGRKATAQLPPRHPGDTRHDGGPRNRTFCRASLRPSLLHKLQEPFSLVSRSTHACKHCSGSDSALKPWDLSAPAPALPSSFPHIFSLPTHLNTHDSWLLKSEHKKLSRPHLIKISAPFYLAANCQLPFKEYQGGAFKKKESPHSPSQHRSIYQSLWQEHRISLSADEASPPFPWK